MTNEQLNTLRANIRARYHLSEADVVSELLAISPLDAGECKVVHERAAQTIAHLRDQSNPTLMESFLGEYGLSTPEGVGLMCLAEALLRVPDTTTIDELIADKLEPSDWGSHLGQSSSSLVNASTWALLLTGRILDDDSQQNNPISALRSVIRRLGEPVVRTAVGQAMKMMGRQFVLGQSIEEALKEAEILENQGYSYSYDMLGEAAHTERDASDYFKAYEHAIASMAKVSGKTVSERPGISVKLSALHPRYEHTQLETVMRELLPRVEALAIAAANANLGFNIDAEEADRLDLSLDVIEALVASTAIPKDWDGFGVVVQAYGRRSLPVIDWLLALSSRYKRKLMVRLVKGAYWDAEIKEAQVQGLRSFPVFTRKASTDLSYLVCARRLLDNTDRIYPQFATHNAHTVTAIQHMAASSRNGNGLSIGIEQYEFQRLHGMGEALHEHLRRLENTRCRVYAPVGTHRDLLAYLVRRLLENGANSSFVNQIVDHSISPLEVARCPIQSVANDPRIENSLIQHPSALFEPERENSKGYRINDPASINPLLHARQQFRDCRWYAEPIVATAKTSIKSVGSTASTQNATALASSSSTDPAITLLSPSDTSRKVGKVVEASASEIEQAVDAAVSATLNSESSWANRSSAERAGILRKSANLYESNKAELSALLCHEAGKTLADCIAEIREAVDFLRYYANQAESICSEKTRPYGVIACISPWNFPLAIFTGQIAGALAAGNVVLAKPAEQTPLIAYLAIQLLHKAGVPKDTLQYLPGAGETVGVKLTQNTHIDGVCFTGSTAVACHIDRALAQRSSESINAGAHPNPMLIAETGGLNAMMVDSTALTEQVVRDVIISSFQSAGQRCSSLRILYVQKEAEPRLVDMLTGAMDALVCGNPWKLATDIGPVIDAIASRDINAYIESWRNKGCVLHQTHSNAAGHRVQPTLIKVDGIQDLKSEVFGPVLHIATFEANAIDEVVTTINTKGYGLGFGLHTRIDDRVQQIVNRLRAGNIYVNRNQIGAVVGSQPFGGEGLSGTGPKAGGPLYVSRFRISESATLSDKRLLFSDSNCKETPDKRQLSVEDIEKALQKLPKVAQRTALPSVPHNGLILPGPTGESNRLSVHPRGPVLLIVDDETTVRMHIQDALSVDCTVLLVSVENTVRRDMFEQDNPMIQKLSGYFNPSLLTEIPNLSAVALATDSNQLVLDCRRALSRREGARIPLACEPGNAERYIIERHICIDTTAAGGNATLLASAGE
ncbi:MAG: bifunctional proline dehydrogenase/L-glutamate gamma-semialdehyde dehydrogenase PutA [Granulosicoccus sp.]